MVRIHYNTIFIRTNTTTNICVDWLCGHVLERCSVMNHTNKHKRNEIRNLFIIAARPNRMLQMDFVVIKS